MISLQPQFKCSGGPYKRKCVPVATGFKSLSIRERQVVLLLVAGKLQWEIAKTLGLDHRTVSNYRTKAVLKLNVQNDIELVHRLLKDRVIENLYAEEGG